MTGSTVEYNRDVRPILANHCFKCHGPDDQARQAGVRLDRRENATAEAESGATPIVPSQPEASELVRRILSADAETQMPPPSANKPLSTQQRDILRTWIEEGARYQSHWAFVPPVRAPLPPVRNATWPRNSIDYFVLAKIEAAGLEPSGEADRSSLARRVYLDLLGLPPPPEEIDAFVNDVSPDAYESLVDRLLASPHYGERWARRWLDLARYADTNGYEKDRARSIWPYRDWVIAALNDDVPYDRFSIAQLAGDMLGDAKIDSRIATGFHRNTMLNEEGGVDPLEFRHYAMIDRVNTTGTIWLGLTVGCAQCHAHKFDPIPHRDYYRLMAFLNNADEPEIDVPKPEIAAQRSHLAAQIAAAEAELPNRFPPQGDLRWLDATQRSALSASGAPLEVLADGSMRVGGTAPDTDVYTLELVSDAPDVSALRLDVLADPQLPKQGPGRSGNGNFVLTEISAAAAPQDSSDPAAPIALAAATADFSQDGFPIQQALDGNRKTGWAVRGPEPWNVSRTAIFRFSEPRKATGSTRWTIRLEQDYGGGHTLGRFRVRLGQSIHDDRPLEIRRQENLDRQFNAWAAAQTARAARWTLLKPLTATSNVPTLRVLGDGSVLASGDQTKSDLYKVSLSTGLPKIRALRLEVLPHDSLPKNGPGRIAYEGPFGDFFLSEFRAYHNDQAVAIKRASHSFASGNNTASAAIDGDQQTGWSVNAGQGRAHTAVFLLTEPLTDAKVIDLQMLFERYYAAGLGRFRVWATDDARDLDAFDLPTDVEAALQVPAPARSAEQTSRLLAHFLSVAPELAAERAAIAKLRVGMQEFPTTLVMAERPPENPRQTHLHKRGEFLQPTEVVEPRLPAIFAPLPAGTPANRLALARFLLSEANPLVGRVTVNRHWATLFGRGIVRTTEDFGYQGDPPTHAELLDWLAVDFVRQGWSVKKLHRLIVTSATYRQSSRATSAALERDPQNKLLARAPRVRLDAELVRDAALRSSGLLSDVIGGPSVFPPQPAGVASEGTYGPLTWKPSEGADRFRRGLYTFAKRTSPFAMLTTFDAPSGEACLARREISNTPLQSLTLLNDTVFVEAAQALGNELAGRATSIDERVDELFKRCVSRAPIASEHDLIVRFYHAQHERLMRHEIDAAAIATGSAGDVMARAAWILTARAMMNLDETITKE
ncbi:MAG TPA: PSD1 and planctomycete cytochrome C domain-containing protein [Pirellulales bacterium]|nr:PSD1 and planctomycete cytochrome C domain-containing protein [Pirellulales bacterium]